MKMILLLLVTTTILLAQPEINNSKYEKTLAKKSGNEQYSLFNINNISTYIYNNGEADNNGYNSGFVFPKGSGKTVIYTSGFLFGGKVDGEIKMNGSVYSSGMTPGKILQDGTTEDSESENVRVFRVRPDYKTADLSNEINDGEGTEEEIRAQYEKDWNEWRAEDGAPFFDINNDGIYDPLIDIPGLLGAAQTLWFVTNDLGDASFHWSSDPSKIGVEIQTTIWGYRTNDELENVLFKKYKIINKGNKNIDDVYVARFSDADIGATGNFAGCDTLLNMGFGYNGGRFDDMYGLTTAAIGYDFVQGPLVEGEASDKAIYDGKIISGKKNLYLTTYVDFICGGNVFPWPNTTNRWYNYLQGKMEDGSFFQVPNEFGGGSTKFIHNGDPLLTEGWLDGHEYPSGCRYLLLSSGPFTLAAGDTQEVVIAEIAAVGKDRFNSVRLLKYYSNVVQNKYDNLFGNPPTPVIPSPTLQVTENNNNLLLSFGNNSEVQNYNESHFKFQGFNLYQIYSDINFKENAVRIATFDIDDGVKEITGDIMDSDGSIILGAKYFGTDSGIPSQLEVTKDYITNSDFTERQNYYFGISAYFYASSVPKLTFETELGTAEIIYKDDVPGIRFKDLLEVTQSSGNAEAYVHVEVLELTKLTDLDYTISFGKKNISGRETMVWNIDRADGQSLLDEEEIFWKSSEVDGLRIKINATSNDLRIENAAFYNGFLLKSIPFIPIVSDNSSNTFRSLGYGTRESSKLFDNYEFRFSGERDSVLINDKTVYITKEGTGSIATVFNDRDPEYLIQHPLNPTGTAKRFTVRIPLEVWNVDKGIQVNYQMEFKYIDNTTNYSVWDISVYSYILDLPYDGNIITEEMVDTSSSEFIGDGFTHFQRWKFTDWKKET